MAEQNATTQSPNVIGEVKSITGKVVAIGAGGERTLAAGDPVFADDLIKTIGVSTVVITLNDGTRFDLGRDAEGLLDESVYGGDIEVLRAAAVVEAAEIQRAIAEGADPTAVTEPPAAGETTTGSESLGEGVTVERTGRVGAVEAGYETTAPGQAVDSLFGEPIDFGLTAEQPTASIVLDPVTADNIVNAAESGGLVAITGTVGGDVADGDIVTLIINGVEYSGPVSGGQFSIAVPGGELVADPDQTIEASVTTSTGGPAGEATAVDDQAYSSDTFVPDASISLDPVTADNVISAAESGTVVTLTGSVGGDVVDGDTVTVIVNGDAYTGVVSDGRFSVDVPGSELAADPDQTVEASVTTSTGSINGEATAVDDQAFGVDTDVPEASITLDPVTADNLVNFAESGGPVAITGSVGGDVADGDTVIVTVNGVEYSGPVNGGVFSITVPGGQLVADADHTIQARVTTTTGSVNGEATASDSQSYGVDTTPPVAPATASIVIDPVTADNLLTDAEAGGDVSITGRVGGDVADGDIVFLNVNGSVYQGPVSGGTFNISVSGAQLLADADHTIQARVTTTTGNPGGEASATDSQTYFVESGGAEPTIDIDPVTGDNQVDDSEDDSVTLSGSTTGVEPGQTVSVVIEDGTGATVFSGSATVQADGSWSIPGVDLSGLPDGAPYTVLADVSDAAGNPALQASEPFQTVDTTAPPAPTVTIVEDADNDGVITAAELSGDIDVQVGLPLGAVAGDVIRVSDGVTVTEITLTPGDIVAGSVSASFANPGNGNTIDVTATLTDAAGNTSAPGSDSAILNLVTASITIDPNITPDDLISPDEQTGDVLVTGTVGGDVADGDIVTLTVNGGTYQGPVSGGTFSIAVPGAELAADADNVIEAGVTVTDVLGNDITATDIEGYSVAQVIDPAEYGMRGEYYGYNDINRPASWAQHSDDRSVGNLDSLNDIVSIIDGRSGPVIGTIDEGAADATFRTSYVDYGQVNNHLGTGRTLQSFLAHDAASLSRDPRDSTDAIVRIIGFMMIDATSLDFRVRSDDGFQIRIGETVFGNPTNHAPTTDMFSDVGVEAGLQEVEILYWDQAYDAVLEIEVKAADGPDSAFEFLGQGRFGLFQPTFDVALDANQTIIEDPSTPGQFLVVEGSELVGGAGTDVLEGGDYL
ncbi:MAG: retention module-containing protein, partial [Gammaproteobacteria bacterium]|nr:retention module-containing protein [Gammaproteobacteria bacterium]